jgi:DNA-binding transcriptional LysR family regulator
MHDVDDGGTVADGELDRLAATDLNLLVPLMALLEERSVTRAAARVGLSQPAMSHALRRIRRLLGDQVVVRRGNDLTLTPRAAALVAPLRQALQSTARVVGAPEFDPATGARTFSVGLTNSTAFVVGAPLARLLSERAPNAGLRLPDVPAVPDSAFTDEGVDVLLLPETFATRFPRERLFDDRWVVVASPDAPKDATAVELLETLPHVLFDVSPQRLLPYAVLDEHHVRYRVRARVSDSLLVAYLVAGTGAVALHRYSLAAAMSAHVPLRIEDFPFPLQGQGVDMVWNPWLTDEPVREWLRSLLVEVSAGLAPRPPAGGAGRPARR